MGSSVGYALRSALSQDFPSFEILVLDDGSTDETWGLLQSFSDSRLRLLKNGKREGLTAARNRLLREAQGSFLSILDADDRILPNKLRVHAEALLKNEKAGVVWSRAIVKDCREGRIGVLPVSHYQSTWDLSESYQAIHSATSWRKEALEKAGGYDSSRTLVEDADMFLKVGDHFEQVYVPELVAVKFRDSLNEFRRPSRDEERRNLTKELFSHTVFRRYGVTFQEQR